MIRAQFKDKDYFDARVHFRIKCIDSDIVELTTNHSFDSEIKMNYAIGLVTDHLILLEQKYSRGDAIDTLVNEVKAVLFYRQLQKEYADNLPPEEQSYRHQREEITTGRLFNIYRWFAFALAVGMDNTYFKEALTLINLPGEDYLLDAISVKLGYQQSITHQQFAPRVYGKLITALEALVDKQTKAMNHYMDYWYRTNEIKDMHIESIDGYTGYWCYEAALVTRLWQLDDSGWRDHAYYPRDLVR